MQGQDGKFAGDFRIDCLADNQANLFAVCAIQNRNLICPAPLGAKVVKLDIQAVGARWLILDAVSSS